MFHTSKDRPFRLLHLERKDPVLNEKLPSNQSGPKPLRFSEGVHRETQRHILSEYETLKEKYPDMIGDEDLEPRHWMANGNSPFKNPDDIRDENGLIADFIYASRIIDEALS